MKRFIETLKNIWKIEDLRSRILYTLGIILIYRLGTHIVLPGIDPVIISEMANSRQGGTGSVSRSAARIRLRWLQHPLDRLHIRNLARRFHFAVHHQSRCEHHAELHYVVDLGDLFQLVFDSELVRRGLGVFGELAALAAARAEYLYILHCRTP